MWVSSPLPQQFPSWLLPVIPQRPERDPPCHPRSVHVLCCSALFSLQLLPLAVYRSFLFLKYLFLAALGLAICGLSLVVGSRGYSLFAVHRRLFVVASLESEHRLSSYCPLAYLPRCMWDILRSGMQRVPPALAGGFLTHG